MGEVSRGGRTVLFVSHNMAAIENLCSRAVVCTLANYQYDGTSKDGDSYLPHSLSSRRYGHKVELDGVGARVSQQGRFSKTLSSDRG